ncbi:hypothetical protein EGR_11184 [Echinococcus granulosus]|uniref:Uncharacterized protein n=1 Tax=Echinococcus granulosus TaxID=6210 RepID=W6TZ23_ECHGR|nr:hypothetical protein EGR_11184 [Echinococcus granulosus]EUB53958.1 hypothetical protein EGR_11184 [Echinococcus granulosus]
MRARSVAFQGIRDCMKKFGYIAKVIREDNEWFVQPWLKSSAWAENVDLKERYLLQLYHLSECLLVSPPVSHVAPSTDDVQTMSIPHPSSQALGTASTIGLVRVEGTHPTEIG